MNKERFNVEEHATLDGKIIDVFPISHRYIHDLEQQVKKQKEVIDKVNEVIDKMINTGYSIGFTHYFATGKDSEFGTRAKRIKDILKEVSE